MKSFLIRFWITVTIGFIIWIFYGNVIKESFKNTNSKGLEYHDCYAELGENPTVEDIQKCREEDWRRRMF